MKNNGFGVFANPILIHIGLGIFGYEEITLINIKLKGINSMKVFPSSNSTQNNRQLNVNNNYKTNNFNTHIAKNNVSFGVEPGTIILVARYGISAVKDGTKLYKLTKFLGEVHNVVTSPRLYNSNIADTLTALSKTPDNVCEGKVSTSLFDSFVNKRSIEYVFEPKDSEIIVKTLRQQAIPLLSEINDASYVNIQAKKDFIYSLFTNGHEITPSFLNEFKKLNDGHYKNLKEEIIDKCLYSKEYNQSRKDPERYGSRFDSDYSPLKQQNLRRFHYNLSLIETLDNGVHSEYLNRNASVIAGQKSLLFQSAKEDLSRGGDLAFDFSNILSHAFTGETFDKDNELLLDGHKYQYLFLKSVFEHYNNDMEKLAKVFNCNNDRQISRFNWGVFRAVTDKCKLFGYHIGLKEEVFYRFEKSDKMKQIEICSKLLNLSEKELLDFDRKKFIDTYFDIDPHRVVPVYDVINIENRNKFLDDLEKADFIDRGKMLNGAFNGIYKHFIKF